MTDPKPRQVSLSGKTRLTYREAVALLLAANRGHDEMDHVDDNDQHSEDCCSEAMRAILKLQDAIDKAGGYREDGSLIDPFEERTT